MNLPSDPKLIRALAAAIEKRDEVKAFVGTADRTRMSVSWGIPSPYGFSTTLSDAVRTHWSLLTSDILADLDKEALLALAAVQDSVKS